MSWLSVNVDTFDAYQKTPKKIKNRKGPARVCHPRYALGGGDAKLFLKDAVEVAEVAVCFLTAANLPFAANTCSF